MSVKSKTQEQRIASLESKVDNLQKRNTRLDQGLLAVFDRMQKQQRLIEKLKLELKPVEY